MLLQTHRWEPPAEARETLVYVHGLTQDGKVFDELGRRLAAGGRRVVAVDLRGHGASRRMPPWNIDTHCEDLIETVDALGIETATWIGHSFGGRLSVEIAARAPERVTRLALLDPGFRIAPGKALKSAEMDRLDWSFATVEGAVNALMSSDSIVSAPWATVEAFAKRDMRRGTDDRLRFSFCPSVAVVAWSEMTLPPPPVAQLPTLIVRADASVAEAEAEDQRYRDELGPLLTFQTVPNGHNVLWESPSETAVAVESFLDAT
jgi:lipase